MQSFAAITSLERVGPGHHRTTIDRSWLQGRGAYGGLSAALAARAIEREAPEGQRLLRLTTAFTAPLVEGEATVEVAAIRAGRNVSTLTATLRGADGVVAATALGTAAREREHPIHLAAPMAPAVPPPEHVPDGPEEHYIPAFARRFSFRQCLGPRPFSDASEARVGGWCRLDEPAPLDAALVAALLDAWPPAAAALSPGWCPVASLEMTIELAVPARATPWLLYDARASWAEHGVADERASLFLADGTWIGSSQQLVALFPPAPRPAG